ncbi:MAG: Rid family detoxifying hydrolase [Anaerolineae bacterium]
MEQRDDAPGLGRIVDLGVGHNREVIQTDGAPEAVGPYSQAIRVDFAVFTTGQIGLDPATGKLVEGGIVAETRRALENLKAVLEAAGSSMSRVAKTTVYLADIDDFQAMNEVYAEYFGTAAPARSTLAAAALPLGAKVEIEAVALAMP